MNMNLREIGSEPITPWTTLSKSIAERNKNISEFINKSFENVVTSKEISTRNTVSSRGNYKFYYYLKLKLRKWKFKCNKINQS